MARAVIEDVKACIDNKQAFILEAGAGAGKTHTLLQTIDYIQATNPKASILCITYTNVAKDEIRKRSKNDKIEVNTLHEFLWGFLKQFQLELTKAVKAVIELEKESLESDIKKAEGILAKPRKNTNIVKKTEELNKAKSKLEKYTKTEFKEIKYTGYKQLYKGNLGHDDVIKIAIGFLEKQSFIDIFLNQYNYIFIDEYQDTNLDLLNKIIEAISNKSSKYRTVIGFFGDKMQQIYSNGPLDFKWGELGFKVIEKTENHRSNEKIINGNNSLRGDGFIQVCADKKIPLKKYEFIINVSNQDKYLENYLNEEYGLFKRLYLTHKEIATDLGFLELSNAFSNYYEGFLVNDKFLKLEDVFINFLVRELLTDIHNYFKGDHTFLLKKLKAVNFTLKELEELNIKLKENLNVNKALKEIIDLLKENNLFNNAKYNEVQKYYEYYEAGDFIEELLNISLEKYLKFYSFINKETMLETMAGVKGEEYDNVVVNISSDTGWTKYNFNEFFLSGFSDSNSIKNTHKLFYVCCTRAKSSLIINYIINDIINFDDDKFESIKKMIRNLFGEFIEISIYDNNIKSISDSKQDENQSNSVTVN